MAKLPLRKHSDSVFYFRSSLTLMLSICGIDQETFFEYIDQENKSTK